MGEVGGWVGLVGVYSSIKRIVKVVVTTVQREDSSDQELLVSSTLLSTEDRARVFLYYAPLHVTTCSAPLPKHSPSCCWQTPFYLCWLWWLVSAAVMKILPAVTTPLLRTGKKNTEWKLHFIWLDFTHNMCCVLFKASINRPSLIQIRYSLTWITYY